VKLLGLLPEAPPAHALALALDLALSAGLLSREALEPLRGKTIALEATDLGARVRVEYGPAGFRASRREPDVRIRSTVSGYVALALRRADPDTLFFNRRLVIEGDTELGLVAKNALDAVDWSKIGVRARFSAMQDRGQIPSEKTGV
jgi:predicted lipid carrier protein YhbT